MSRMKRIFDVFSRRNSGVESTPEISEASRNRILLWCDDLFANRNDAFGPGDYRREFWEQVHQILRYKHGKFQLTDTTTHLSDVVLDTQPFLLQCSPPDFLDFLEYVFRVDCYFHVRCSEEDVVRELNEIIRASSLPYFVTDFVKKEEEGMFHGQPSTVIKTVCRRSLRSVEI